MTKQRILEFVNGAGILVAIIAAPVTVLSSLLGQTNLPPEFQAVRKYILEKDYPEVIGGVHYRARVEGFVIADVANDGGKEVVVQYFPHYLQSATVVFYRIDEKAQVTRVTEGLAPGPVQRISGDYLDSHATGNGVDATVGDQRGHGVDATVGDQKRPGGAEGIIQAARNNFGGLVIYKNFFHMDGRSGPLAYLDMTHVELPPAVETCRDFEFSRVRQISVGPPQGETRNYLAAWVGDEIYMYLIKRFREDGLIDKQLWIRKAPVGFEGFIPGQGLSWKTKSGAVEVLARQ